MGRKMLAVGNCGSGTDGKCAGAVGSQSIAERHIAGDFAIDIRLTAFLVGPRNNRKIFKIGRYNTFYIGGIFHFELYLQYILFAYFFIRANYAEFYLCLRNLGIQKCRKENKKN